MSLIFKAEKHEYISTGEESIPWISVTSLLSPLKSEFDDPTVAAKSSKKKNSKWFGLDPLVIQEIWSKEAKRATDLGTWYHDQREKDICGHDTFTMNGYELPVIMPDVVDGVKHAPIQRLEPGIYPEHLVYLKSAGICGQSDLVTCYNGKINILDYKTNKKINTEGFVNWEGKRSMMKDPVSHLDDCHLMHYALQLSIYMYIMLKHNPKLEPGELTIHHIKFEEAGRDKYDYPITALNENGEPTVTEVIPYKLPYLKNEVIAIMKDIAANRDKYKKKKN